MFSKSTMSGLAATLVLSGPVLADADAPWQDDRPGDALASDYDYARVTHVEPRYRAVRISVPRQECVSETRYVPVAPGVRAGAPGGGRHDSRRPDRCRDRTPVRAR